MKHRDSRVTWNLRSALAKLLILVGACIGSPVQTNLQAADFYVSTVGNDQDPGTRERPFASLEKARDAARRLPHPLTEPVTIYVRGGTYFVDREFELFGFDGGSETAPVTYRAMPDEVVRFVGGKSLKDGRPVTDPQVLSRLPAAARKQVRQYDLSTLGLKSFGALESRGYSRGFHTAYHELYFDGQRLPLARWPNEDWSRISGLPAGTTSDELGGNLGDLSAGFRFDDDRIRRWQELTNAWILGFWSRDWAVTNERIAAYDPEQRIIRTAPPYGVRAFKSGQRIRFMNVLEELDEPGEWYLDRAAARLYVWPPNKASDHEMVLSTLDRPLVTLRRTSFVRFVGMSFEVTRSFGIWIEEGRSNQVVGCTVRNIGNFGVYVVNGTGHLVSGCDVYNTGDGGVGLKGGDILTLTPAGHRVENCDLHHNGNWAFSYFPGIHLTGVGLIASHNHIHDHPHIGLLFEGNDHLIEGNEIDHVSLLTADNGAIYSGRRWDFRGTEIRQNYIHDVVGVDNLARGVYQDDCSSGTWIHDNLFQRVKVGIHVAGGRDHRIENNVFLDCEYGVYLDGRGLGSSPLSVGLRTSMKELWYSIPAPARENFRRKYSELAPLEALMERSSPIPPEGNRIVRNIGAGGRFLEIQAPATSAHFEARDNVQVPMPGLFGIFKSDRRIPRSVMNAAEGFVPLDPESAGIRSDSSRRLLPSLPTPSAVVR